MARLEEFVWCMWGGYKLKCDSLAAHIILEARWTFVFKHLELGAKAPIGELGMEDGVGSDEICFTSRLYRLRDDCVSVMVVEDHEVRDAVTGGDREAASTDLSRHRFSLKPVS